MALTDLIPFNRFSRGVSAPRLAEENDPFVALQRSMNRMFDEFTNGFGLSAMPRTSWTAAWPHVEVKDGEREVKLIAELPGMEQSDIDISLQNGMLLLKGEKKAESEGALYSERWHGKFQRSLQLGPEIDSEQVSASFKNGVLTVTLGKHTEAQSPAKRIPINNG